MHLKMVLFCLNIKKNEIILLKNVKDFIQEIESMSEKVKLSLFEDLFDYAKMLINTENSNKNKERQR